MFRLLIVAAAALIMGVGISHLRSASVDVLPEFTPPYIEIQTDALGLSAEEVEQLITVPIELDLDARGYQLGLHGGYDAPSPATKLRPRRE